LLTDALHHLTQILRGEVALAKAEVEEKLRNAVSGLVLLILAFATGLVALTLLAAAAAFGLVAQGLAAGWAALVVAIVFACAAFGLILMARSALDPSNLALRRTATSLRRDALQLKEIFTNDTVS
jgi:succinate dehydrogenase hydrophobic anchor subunit